jgi:hypothetical protein
MRTFDTGATRDTDANKPDYEGFLSPLALAAFGRYMTKHQVQADGLLRASDNWQKGIPRDVYIKSAWRHFVDWWRLHRALQEAPEPTATAAQVDALCALMFNVQGYLHELLKAEATVEETAVCTDCNAVHP